MSRKIFLCLMLSFTADSVLAAGLVGKIQNLIDMIDNHLLPEPEVGVSNYVVGKTNYSFKDISESNFTSLDEPESDDDYDTSDIDSDDNSDTDSDDEYFFKQSYADYYLGEKEVKFDKDTVHNSRFSTKLNDVSIFNPQLDRDYLVYRDFSRQDNLGKAYLLLQKSFLNEEIKNKNLHLLKEPMELLESYLAEYLSEVYNDKNIGVKCYSAIVRHYDKNYSNSSPHLDGMSSMVLGNNPDNKQILESLLALNHISNPYSDMNSIQSFIKEKLNSGKFIQSINVWGPLQDSPVGIPLAFLHDNDLSDYSLNKGRVYYTPKRKVFVEGDLYSQTSNQLDKIVDHRTWVYKKDMKFGGVYIWDTFRKVHSAFNIPNDKRSRSSVDMRFLIYKKN